jgi:hypothetical protein
MKKDFSNETHKTSINIPIDLFSKLKEESKVLGINLNALILIKIQELEKQNDAFKLLNRVLNEIEQQKNK